MQYDVCILGGGMVGAAAALAMAKLNLKTLVIEAHAPQAFKAEQAPELRVSALNMFSVELLEDLEVWSNVIAMRSRAYTQLSCWEREEAKTTFDASDVKRPYLGYFVENRILQLALWQVIEDTQDVDIIIGTKAAHIDWQEAKVSLDNGDSIEAKIILGADGAQSQVRQTAGIGVSGWQYQQNANVFSVKMREPIAAQTWQQFTPSGPVALLPMYDNYASLVWYCSQAKTDYLQQCNQAVLAAEIKQKFPDCLGDFELLDRAYFSLTRQHANHYYAGKVVLIGDAAHTINPLAGQGVNLGFKDIAALYESLKKHGLSEYTQAFETYERKRRTQNLMMMTAMDGIYYLFSNTNPGLHFLRNSALRLADVAGPIKNQVLKHAMGLD